MGIYVSLFPDRSVSEKKGRQAWAGVTFSDVGIAVVSTVGRRAATASATCQAPLVELLNWP